MDDHDRPEFRVALRRDQLDPTRHVLRLHRRDPGPVRAPVRRRWKWVLRTGVSLAASSLLAVTPATVMTALHPESMLYGALLAVVVVAGFLGMCTFMVGASNLNWVDRWRPVHPAPLKAAAAAVVDVDPEPGGYRLVPSDRVPGLMDACEKKMLEDQGWRAVQREQEAKRQREFERLAGQAPTPRS